MTEERIIDVPRLRKELEYITANRLQWLQDVWLRRTACGTVGCLAGNVVLNAGYLPVVMRGEAGTHLVSLERVDLHDPAFDLGTALESGLVREVRAVAAELLGLDRTQATTLFNSSRWTLLDLWKIASDLTDGEIEVPAEVRAEALDGTRPPSGNDLVQRNHRTGTVLRRAHLERLRRRLIDELTGQL